MKYKNTSDSDTNLGGFFPSGFSLHIPAGRVVELDPEGLKKFAPEDIAHLKAVGEDIEIDEAPEIPTPAPAQPEKIGDAASLISFLKQG